MKIKNSLLLTALIAIFGSIPDNCHGQIENSANTFRLEKGTSSPPAKLEAVAWIAGRWQGTGMGGQIEETWNPPQSGVMMGMFRFVGEDNTFYELLTMIEQEETILLRLKHFDKDLKGWEEKDKTVEFKLVEITNSEVRFEGLTFRRIDADTIHVFVVVSKGEKKNEIKFEYHRVENIREPHFDKGQR